MKGQDLINSIIPDEVLIKVFRHLDGQKSIGILVLLSARDGISWKVQAGTQFE